MITVYKRKTLPKKAELITLNDIFFNKNTAHLLDNKAKSVIMHIDQTEMVNQGHL